MKKQRTTKLSSRPVIKLVWFSTFVVAPAAERPRWSKKMKNKYLIAFVFLILCSHSAFADSCPINDFKNELIKLGNKNVSAVDDAATALIKSATNKDNECREKLIHEFRNYYYAALEYQDKESGAGNWDNPISQSKKRKLNSSLSKVGWILRETEGIYYIGEEGGWFEKRFKSILTEPYKEYFKIRSKEIKEGFSEDAGLLISWEQLRKRIAKLEQFLKTYPNFEEKKEIQGWLDLYIGTFLSGMDNSRIVDSSGKLSAEVKTAYEKYLKEDKTSAYYKGVKENYEMLKKNNFLVPYDYNEYLKKKGYETMIGKQPPAY